MRKLYMVEGIPGSGKTTLAKKLAETLKEKGTVHTYLEGSLHPADMAWCALLSAGEYDKVRIENQAFAEAIEKNSSDFHDKKIVAYTNIDGLSEELSDFFSSKEVYDGRVPTETFMEVHKSRWESFGKTAQDITIFECAFLQNHVNELLLFQQKSEHQILDFLMSLYHSVEELSPELIYLDVDTKGALTRAADERIDENGTRVWEQMVIEYVANSPWGRAHKLSGLSGMQEYFAYRKQVELSLLARLPLESHFLTTDIARQEQAENDFLRMIL